MCDSEFMPVTNEREEFMRLPYDLRYMIIKQINLQSFIRLKRCSKVAMEMCENCGFVPNVYMDEMIYSPNNPDLKVNVVDQLFGREEALVSLNQIPMQCKIIINVLIMHDLANADCADLFRGRKATISQLDLSGNIRCTPVEFNAFLKKHEVNEMFIHERTDSTDIDFYNQPAVRELFGLTIMHEKEPLPTETFLGLRAQEIEIYRLYQEALRPILNEWVNGSREIRNLSFHDSELYNHEEREQQFLMLFHTLFDDIEAEHEINFAMEGRRAIAVITRADGRRLHVDVNYEGVQTEVRFYVQWYLEIRREYIASREV